MFTDPERCLHEGFSGKGIERLYPKGRFEAQPVESSGWCKTWHSGLAQKGSRAGFSGEGTTRLFVRVLR